MEYSTPVFRQITAQTSVKIRKIPIDGSFFSGYNTQRCLRGSVKMELRCFHLLLFSALKTVFFGKSPQIGKYGAKFSHFSKKTHAETRFGKIAASLNCQFYPHIAVHAKHPNIPGCTPCNAHGKFTPYRKFHFIQIGTLKIREISSLKDPP